MIKWRGDFGNFPFKYFPSNFENECVTMPTLSEFQRHVEEIELDKKEYLETTFKKMFKLAQITSYDIIICDKWAFQSNDEIPIYQLICKDLIFHDSDMDEKFLLCALRLLYICPMCFHHLQEKELIILTEKLIDLVINKEEPLCSHAIKCLQVVTYFLSENGKVIPNFDKLFKVVIDRLLVMIDIPDRNSLIPFKNLNYKKIQTLTESIDINELRGLFKEAELKKNRQKLNVCTYMDIGQISNSSSQKFHHMALLNYIVLYIDIDEIVENSNLMELLNACITRKGKAYLALRCFALSIICNNIKYDKFMIKLVEKKCLERIFAIPYNPSSQEFVSIVLKNIQKNTSFLEYIIVNEANFVVWMLRYAIKMYSISDNLMIHTFLINLVNRSQFSEIFNNMNGIKQILDEIKKRSWYISLTAATSNTTFFKSFYYEYRKNLDFAAKFLLDHTLTFVCSITPAYILNSIPGENISDANFVYLNTILKYYQNIGGIRHDVQFFDSILETDSFYVIITLVRNLCEYDYFSSDLNEKRMKALRDVVCVLKLLSLYHKSIIAFTRFYDPYPGQLTKGNNLISFFKALIEFCKGCNFYFELLPFEIYTNLLMFLFPDTESYRSSMFSIDEKCLPGSNTISCNEINIPFRNLTNLLQKNSIVHHALELLSTISERKTCILAKISTIKCLILLTNETSVMKIICALKHQLEEKIHASLFAMIHCEHHGNDSLIFLRYAFKFIEIIDINYKISDPYTFKNFEENTYFDRFYIMSFISQLYPSEFLMEEIEQIEKKLLKKNRGNLCNCKRNISFLENVFWVMIKSLSSDTKNHSMISTGRQNNLTKYSINLMSHCDLTKIKHKKTLTRSRHGLLYKTFNDTKTYNSIEKTDCFYSVKILDDDNIIATDSRGIHCVTGNGSTYSHSSSKIYYIDTSPDGQLLIGGGILDAHETRFVDVWRYNQSDSLKNIKPCRNWADLSWAKISKDNKNIIGMNKTFTAKMFDIEKGNLIRDYYNETAQSFSKMASIEISEPGNVILFNGDLFCTRSGKLISNFARFSSHISGIFMPSNFEVLINTELWDLRTFNLLERFHHLKDIVVKRTSKDNILFGERIIKNCEVYTLKNHLYDWSNFNSFVSDYIALYNSKDLSKLVKFKFYRDLMFASLSNNCTKLATGFNNHDEDNEPSHTFRVIGIVT